MTDYADRLYALMRKADVTKVWRDAGTLLRRLYDKTKADR